MFTYIYIYTCTYIYIYICCICVYLCMYRNIMFCQLWVVRLVQAMARSSTVLFRNMCRGSRTCGFAEIGLEGFGIES